MLDPLRQAQTAHHTDQNYKLPDEHNWGDLGDESTPQQDRNAFVDYVNCRAVPSHRVTLNRTSRWRKRSSNQSRQESGGQDSIDARTFDLVCMTTPRLPGGHS